jgi:hypothetical protein
MEAARNPEEEAKAMASMRLAYQDISLQQKKEEERLKKVDPSKAAQIERLGMGFGGRCSFPCYLKKIINSPHLKKTTLHDRRGRGSFHF